MARGTLDSLILGTFGWFLIAAYIGSLVEEYNNSGFKLFYLTLFSGSIGLLFSYGINDVEEPVKKHATIGE